MTEELKPCPFCGGAASFKPKSFKASCDKCGAHVPVGATDSAEAIAAWNTRAAPRGWQPIETAPKDGTLILLLDPRGPVVGKWRPVLHKSDDGEWVAWFDGDEAVHHIQYDEVQSFDLRPTHWKPAEPPA